MSRQQQPTLEEIERFGRSWQRYLRRTTVRAMQDGTTESMRSALLRVTERLLRLRGWERRCAVMIMVSRSIQSVSSEEIQRWADHNREDRQFLDRAMDLATQEADRLHRERTP